ncbi:hypothetical protein ACFRQM_07650 [Streptomyces sp. NPDC056831]|uniref:hypothetical protein n=1 Tax=Streptomyces sp. NPDC056831 TaxID=3345954 RepID=UPI00367FA155
MSVVYAVDLALNLRASAPSAVLADLRRHLGIDDAADAPADGMTGEIGDMFPCSRHAGPRRASAGSGR